MRIITKTLFVFALSACGVALAEQPAPTTAPAPSTTVAPATTTTTSTTTTTVPPTTTTTLPALTFEPKCPNLIPYARAAGFPESELKELDRIAYRESRCSLTGDGQWRCSHNADDPGSGEFKGSWGPYQVNQSWTVRDRWNPHPAGYLGNLGILDETTDLCDWQVAANAAKALWDYSIARHGWEKRWWQWKT
jgi:hypothetical protein